MAIDVLLDSNYDIPLRTTLGTGIEVILQRIQLRLQQGLGEWVYDTTTGLPWLDWSQDKPVDVDNIGARIRREIESVPEVVRVTEWETVFDRATRTITCTGAIETEEGEAAVSVIPYSTTLPHNRWPFVELTASEGIAP